MMSTKALREVADQYFEDHPEAKDSILKAYYAYHAPHFRLEPKGHNFTSSFRESRCVWCGRSREMVRHDDLPGQCQDRPFIPEIKDAIYEEEVQAVALSEKAKTEVPKLVKKMGMSGETLAVLHHTYGHDPETVATVIDVPREILSDYYAMMEKEKERSRTAQKKTTINVEGFSV